MTVRPSGTPVFGFSALPRSSLVSLSAWLTYSCTAVLVLGAAREAHHVGVLGGHHEEGRAEERVRAGGEDGIVDVELLAAEVHLGALAAADPVALHRLHVLGPLDPVEVAEQPLGVVGDAQEPLLELA